MLMNVCSFILIMLCVLWRCACHFSWHWSYLNWCPPMVWSMIHSNQWMVNVRITARFIKWPLRKMCNVYVFVNWAAGFRFHYGNVNRIRILSIRFLEHVSLIIRYMNWKSKKNPFSLPFSSLANVYNFLFSSIWTLISKCGWLQIIYMGCFSFIFPGYKMSRPLCRNRMTSQEVEESLCNAVMRPEPAVVQCNTHSCPPK